MTNEEEMISEYSVFLIHGMWAVGTNKRGLRTPRYEFVNKSDAEGYLARLQQQVAIKHRQAEITRSRQRILPITEIKHVGKHRGEMF